MYLSKSVFPSLEKLFIWNPAVYLFFIKNTRVFLGLFLLLLFSFVVFHIESWDWIRRFKMEFFFIFFGGLVAVLEENKKLEFLKVSGWIPFIITVLIVLFFTTTWFNFEPLWVYNMYITILFGLFIHSIAINNHGVAIRTPILVYLGEITYGLYLYHIIVVNLVVFVFMKLAHKNMFSDTISLILMNLISFGLTIFVSHLSYKYFETYFLNLKDKYR